MTLVPNTNEKIWMEGKRIDVIQYERAAERASVPIQTIKTPILLYVKRKKKKVAIIDIVEIILICS